MRNLLLNFRKGWFWERRDPDDPVTGYLSLAWHPDQYVLKEILFGIKASRLWGAIRRYDLVGLVASLPSDYRKPAFVEYAKMLMERIGKEDGHLVSRSFRPRLRRASCSSGIIRRQRLEAM